MGNTGAWTESLPLGVKRITKYYTFGGKKVAMRKGGAVYYLHTDHLGSTSLTTDASGSAVYEARYDPFGAARWQSGAAVTDFDFTAQRLDGFGLHDYNARKNRPEGFSKSTLPADVLFCKVAVSKSRLVKPFGSSLTTDAAFNLPGSCSEMKLLEL